MTGCAAPSGALLPQTQRKQFAALIQLFLEHKLQKSALLTLMPGVADAIANTSTDDDLEAWCVEVDQWIRWYRVPAFWLAYALQLATQRRRSKWHLRACILFADAQISFADDLALSSVETAYSGYLRTAATLGGEPAVAIRKALERRLQFMYEYYRNWSQSFDYMSGNPCADHLYTALTWQWLLDSARDEDLELDGNDTATLQRLIDRCTNDEFVVHRVVARRFLGLRCARDGRHDEAAHQYQLALEDARRVKLDTEIGHLRRHLGFALRCLGSVNESRHHFEQALAFERLEPFNQYTRYWQALSARELGDTLVRAISLSQPSATNLEATLGEALDAYDHGRVLFDTHLAVDSPMPIARSAKIQLFRSFSANAIQVAALLKKDASLLAEVEHAGPAEATQVIAELAAGRTLDEASASALRQNRAVYYSTLNTLPTKFEEYLATIRHHGERRREYLMQWIAIARPRLDKLQSDTIAAHTLALRIPQTVFLLFHVGWASSWAVVFDADSGALTSQRLAFGERDLQDIQQELQQLAATSTSKEAPVNGLTTRYSALMQPVLEPMLPALQGRHLKIFPRLQMNAVPFHAVVYAEKPLIDYCATISYAPTLGMILETRNAQQLQHATALRVVIGDNVPWYERLLPVLHRRLGQRMVEEHPQSWADLWAAISARPATDTVFACHGSYVSDDPDSSWLQLRAGSTDGRVSFADFFAGLDLRGSRSVLMGACESGLTRTAVSAEYIGLPSAMLASGVRYVLGALWRVPQLATALVVDRFLANLTPGVSAAAALCNAQREVKSLTRDQVGEWIKNAVTSSTDVERLLSDLADVDARPFADPYFWAGLHAVGDV